MEIDTDETTMDPLEITVDLVKFNCKECDQEFLNQELLKIHTLTHFNKTDKIHQDMYSKMTSKCSVVLPKTEIYECNECTRGFLSHRKRQIHLIKHADEKVKQMDEKEEDPRFVKKYKCEFCDYKFVEASTLELHAIVHEPSKYTCYCGIKYRLGEDYLMHKKIIHSDVTITETEQILLNLEAQENAKNKRKRKIIITENLPAKKIKKEKAQIKKSNKLPPGKKKQCKKCKKMYTHKFYHLHSCKSNNNNHVQIKSEETITGDRIIKNKPKTKQKITKNKHKTKDKVVKNKLKSESKITKNNSETKRKIKTEKKPKITRKPKEKKSKECPRVECEICHKVLAKISLKSHINTVHLGRKDFECDICHKHYSQAGARDIHKSIMHNPNTPTYPCSFCNKIFIRKEAVFIHMKIHMGIKDKICKYCGKGYTDQSAMIRHQRTHTGEKRYKCDVCEKRFTEAGTLSIHKLIHKGVKNFKCRVCDKSFYSQAIVNCHFKRVHEGKFKLYKCDHCKYVSKHKNNLSAHLKRMHKFLFKKRKLLGSIKLEFHSQCQQDISKTKKLNNGIKKDCLPNEE